MNNQEARRLLDCRALQSLVWNWKLETQHTT